MRRGAAGLLAVVLGCGPTVAPPAAPQPAPPSAPVVDVTAATPPAPPDPGPTVVVERMEGAEREEAQRLLEAVRGELRECGGEGGGLIRIDLTGSANSTKMTIDPESMGAVDSHTRTCVLKALSTVDLGESLSRPNPSDQPSGFAAQLSISY